MLGLWLGKQLLETVVSTARPTRSPSSACSSPLKDWPADMNPVPPSTEHRHGTSSQSMEPRSDPIVG